MWRDGTSHLLFDPNELLEKLAAIIARPAVNLVLYHGVLASHARWRPQMVEYPVARRKGAFEFAMHPGAVQSGQFSA